MKRETIFLKAAVFLMSIPILALCIWGLPAIAAEVTESYPEWTNLLYLALAGAYGSALVYFVALFQTFKLLSYIDKNNAFSELSVKALRNIKNCAITISILFVAVLPLMFYIAEADDAPGLGGLGLVIILASTVIAVFAAVLEKLLKNAIDIKSENDLTV